MEKIKGITIDEHGQMAVVFRSSGADRLLAVTVERVATETVVEQKPGEAPSASTVQHTIPPQIVLDGKVLKDVPASLQAAFDAFVAALEAEVPTL